MVSWPLDLLALVGCGLFLFQFLKTLHLLRLKKFIDATEVLAYAAVAKLDGQSIYCDHVGFLIFLLLLVFSSHYLSQYKPGVHDHGGEEAVVAAHDFKSFAE